MYELRPSFAERDEYLDLLKVSYADGRIDDAEFEARSRGMLAAVTHRDALAQFEGLPTPHVLSLPPPTPRPTPDALTRQEEPSRAESENNRRNALIGLGVLVGFAGLAAAVIGVAQSTTPSWVEVSEAPLPMLEGVDLMVVQAELEDHGLTEVLEFESEGSLVECTAANPRTPGEATALSCAGGIVTFGEPQVRETTQSADVEQVVTTVEIAVANAIGHVTGDIERARMLFLLDGRLAVEVIVNDGARRRRLVFLEDGTLESMEDA